MGDSDNIVFGRNPVIEALKQGKEIDKILLLKTLRGPFEKEVRQLCKEFDVPLQYVHSRKLDQFTKKNHQGIIAFASLISYQNLEEIVPLIFEQGKVPLLLILDGVSDVRNFGAIARSAEVFGVDAIIIPEKGSARINADAIKTSAGALLVIPVCRVKSLHTSINFLNQSGISIYATDLDSSQEIEKVNFTHPCAVVMGEEGEGVSQGILEKADTRIKIPQVGKTDSLNVSVASGVILYEILKQRSNR